MQRPILLDTSPSQPSPRGIWQRFRQSGYASVSVLAAGGVAAVIGASVTLAVLAPYVVAPQAAAQSAPSELRSSVATVAPAVTSPVAAAKPVSSSGNGVQFVGDVKQSDRPCEEQTWPYIAKHCLKAAPEQAPANSVARVAVDRSDIKTVRAGLPSPVAAPAVQPEQNVAIAPQPAPVPVAMAAPVPTPAARPAPRQTREQAARDAYARAPQETSRRSRPTREARDVRSDVQRVAVSPDRNPSPVVRRWTESDYEVAGPFGTTRRVTVIRQQSVHQAAAFSDER